MLERGTLSVVELEPLHYTPDQFALEVRREVERQNARIVMVDSISGYRVAMQGDDLLPHLHALCGYLKNMGVTVIVVYETAAITGDFQIAEGRMSYLADNIVFLRYVELGGKLGRVVGVLKKRLTDFEKNLRELTISAGGMTVGPTLAGLRGVLTGLPVRDDGGRVG
jgi:circadian clock protein KaiC